MNSDSKASFAAPGNPAANVPTRIKIVKYSLPDMLEELKAELTTSSFAMEQLDQREIGKLFKNKATRAKSKTKK